MTRSILLHDEQDRRRFLSRAASAFLGVGLAPTVPVAMANPSGLARRSKARSVIFLNMAGGMSHIDTFDMKPRNAAIQGPISEIATNVTGVGVSEHFSKLANQMDKICVVRSINSNQGVHYAAYYYLHTSYLQRGTIRHPHLAAWVMRSLGKVNPNLPGNIQILGGSKQVDHGFANPRFGPLKILDPDAGLPNSRPLHGTTSETIDRRLALVDVADRAFRRQFPNRQVQAFTDCYTEALKLMSSSDLAAFDLSKEPQGIQELYGQEKFGKGCLLARRLVEHGVRFVEVTLDGWDTHLFNFETTPKLSRILDRALASLLQDLASRGMLDSTLVVVTTEFGRTPSIERNTMGRGHHPKAFTCLLAGGGVHGGQVYGQTDESGEEVADGLVQVTDLNATIAYALGMSLEDELVSPAGRPFTVADHGQPVLELF